jgi:hypothetical protein
VLAPQRGNRLASTGPESERRPLLGLVALGAFGIIGSLVALPYAWAVAAFACDDAMTAACARQGLALLQLRLAVAGLVVVTLFLLSAALGRRTLARVLLGCSLLLYAAWAIINDAAVHGWS